MKKITLQVLFALLFFGFTSVVAAQKEKEEYKVAAIGFYNLENLFDTIDSPTTNDADFLPTGNLAWNTPKYITKMANLSKVISLLATELNPDGVALLGVAEVENRKVLEDLVLQDSLKNRHYEIVHYDSPDERGIDVGLLYNPKYFTVTSSRAVPVIILDEKTGERDFTRDILYVNGVFGGESIHIMVGHWPSRRGGESASARGRLIAAGVVKHIVDSLSLVDPNAKIIFMGDLNDDPTNKSMTQVLKARANTDELKADEMYNPMYHLYKTGGGTMAYRDAWSLFDQVIVSRALVNKKTGGWQLYKAVVFRQPWLLQTEGAYRGYPFRTFVGNMIGYSDHLPVFLYFLKKNKQAAP